MSQSHALHPDWLAILPKAIWAWTGKPHEFGSSDCVVFVRDVLLAIGAKDPLPRGITWSSRRGALRVLRRVGGIAGQLARTYPEIELSQLRSGDVLAGGGDDDQPMGAVYIVQGTRAWSIVEGDQFGVGGLVSEDLASLVIQAVSWRAFAVQGQN
jgi:hypothetical protein